MRFDELQLHPTILAAVKAEGYETPTPIQQQAIPHVLAKRDLVAVAQTGTGKTAAFALPLLHNLQATRVSPRRIRVLVLSPTRELASQIGDAFRAYGRGLGLEHTVIFGGVGEEPQKQALRRGIDVLVATPGRLLDFMGQRLVDFRNLEVLVLDEADRMLDMGFIHDVRRIITALPKERQTLLFSATMPADVEDLARRFMISPMRVAVTPPATTVDTIQQSVFFVEQNQKRALLLHLVSDPAVKRALVFTRTKHGANRVARALESFGAAAIHGNKSQGAREKALAGFKRGELRLLVATDIAARGIDVEDITHVIQVDLPEVPDQYVHRIGRTARAGTSGVAWAFCASDERPLLRDIEKAIRRKIDVAPTPANLPQSTPPGNEPREPRHGRPRHAHGRASSAPRPSTPKHGAAPSAAPGSSSSASAAAPARTRTFRPGRR